MLEYLSANWKDLLETLAYVVLALSVVVRAVAPLTDTKADDKLAGYVTKLYGLLVRVLTGKKLPPLPSDRQ